MYACIRLCLHGMGRLWLVGSIKLQVSFEKETCKRDIILQKRNIFIDPTNRSHPILVIQGDEDPYDALSCRSFFVKEPLIIWLFCGQLPVNIRHPMGLRHPVVAHRLLSSVREEEIVCGCGCGCV